MPFVTLNSADVANAQLGINAPLLLGNVIGQGNEVLNHALGTKNRIVIRILGEGEIDGIDRLFINSKQVNASDTTLVHFHPGVDGTLGHGLTPDSNGGDQLVDNFWSQLPANFQPTTFSRRAYLMLNVPPDPAAPSAQLTVLGHYRGLKLRQFDAGGNQTGYAFSTNGAEQCLELILRSALKPEWNPSAAAAGGGDLLAAEKARIDFPSFADSVSWCNTLLANGQKRFESSLAIVTQTNLIDALRQLCIMSQLYITEAAGVIYIRADKPRASSFLLTSSHIVPGTADFDKKNLHGVQNRFIPSFRDLNAQSIADIDLPANNGLARSGAGVVTVQTKTNHPFTTGQNVQVIPPQDGSVHESAFDGVFPITSIPSLSQFTYAQSGNANWLLWSEQFDKAEWQKQTNITVTPNTTTDPIGGGTADTISSGVTSGQGCFQVALLISASGVSVTFSVWLKAASNITVTPRVGGNGRDIESGTWNVTTAWQRFTFTHSSSWAGGDNIFAAIIMPVSSSVFAWGAQLEDGATATIYRQTAGENYLLWSERFDNAVWQKQTGVAVVANFTTDPLGGNTADTIQTGATAGVGVFQNSLVNSANGLQFTFTVWLRALSNTAVTLFVARPGFDSESVGITVTNVWTRFTITHSAVWTGVGSVQAVIAITNASTTIFAWGAQLEIGAAANTYIQTADIVGGTSGTRSGNGSVGTPESRFAVKGSPVIDHTQHQNAIGQRGLSLTPIFRVVPATVDLGNNTVERVGRILNFLLARNLGINTTPYVAPWTGTVTCFMDAVDSSNRSLIAQICGDILTVDATVSEEYQGDYEIMKMAFIVPAADGGNSGSNAQSSRATIELTLLQYLAAAFSDTSLVAQAIRASIPGALVPLAAVDSSGFQRLAGTFRNNPTNVTSYFTGGNPLSQSGTSTTILVASSTIQFGDGQVSYNSGSVNPGSYGTWIVYCRDPQFAGGAVTYLAVASTSQSALTAFNDVVVFGQIIMTSGGGAHGAGGGGGACFSGNVKVRVPGGVARLEKLDPVCVIETKFGPRMADLVVSDYCGEMRDMGNRELVTPDHLIEAHGGFWVSASFRWGCVVTCFEGKVYTLHVRTEIDEERHFILEDGTVAHNISPPPQ